MGHTKERIEMIQLLQKLKMDDEKPGAATLRALRMKADLDAFVARLNIVFAPSLHWDGPAIRNIIKAEYDALTETS